MRSPWTPVAAVAFIATASSVGTQQVRGVVSDASGAPLPGVLMQLLDSASRVVAQGLSGDRGAYRLRAPVQGAYVVRSLRIGFRPTASETLTLGTERELTHDVALASIALHLDTVRVSGRASCRIARDSALQSFRVLEQARSAIIAAGLLEQAARWEITRVLFEQTANLASARPPLRRTEWRSGAVTEPWKTVPSDSLHANGYIGRDADSIVYRAPGLDALSSEDFLGDHCFRLAASANPAEIGIAFEPSPARRKLPELNGTLWLDRSTAQLRRLTFRYVNAPLAEQARGAEGELRFARVADGAWVISRWAIRMPMLELQHREELPVRRAPRAEREVAVAGYREVGGELISVRSGADTVWRHAPVMIAGRVADSTGRAVPGARIVVDAARRDVVADTDGRFEIGGVPSGDIALEVHSAALDSLGTFVRMPATVFDTTSDLDVRLPTPASVLRAMCGSAFATGSATGGSGIALVSLQAQDAVVNLSRAKATIEWLSADGTPHWVNARPDREGVAHFCGVPVRQTLILSVSADSFAAPTAQLRIPDDRRVVRAQMVLDPAVAVGAIFAGAVVRDSSDVPIPVVEIVFPELAKSQLTSERGLFRLRDIPAGTHRLLVRKMGYGPVDTAIVIRAGETIQRRIVLARITTLQQVVVTVSTTEPRMRDFEENRRIGLGHFLTRADLAKIEGASLEQALAQVPGLHLVHPTGSSYPGAYVARARGRNSLGCTPVWLEGYKPDCGCFAQVYLDDVPLFTGRENGEVPDINRFSPGQLEAVEYYASAAQTPGKYNGLNSTCGVLVLHTRRPR